MANSPKASKAMTGLAMYIRHKIKLDPRLRELAILQVGYLAKSPYEYSHHVKIGREFGVTDDDIRAIGEETAGRPTKLDALSKAVLRAAREMTNDLAMSDATFAELEKALGREQVIDLDAGDRILQRAWCGCSARCRSTSSRSIRNIWKSIRCRANVK